MAFRIFLTRSFALQRSVVLLIFSGPCRQTRRLSQTTAMPFTTVPVRRSAHPILFLYPYFRLSTPTGLPLVLTLSWPITTPSLTQARQARIALHQITATFSARATVPRRRFPTAVPRALNGKWPLVRLPTSAAVPPAAWPSPPARPAPTTVRVPTRTVAWNPDTWPHRSTPAHTHRRRVIGKAQTHRCGAFGRRFAMLSSVGLSFNWWQTPHGCLVLSPFIPCHEFSGEAELRRGKYCPGQ